MTLEAPHQLPDPRWNDLAPDPTCWYKVIILVSSETSHDESNVAPPLVKNRPLGSLQVQPCEDPCFGRG